MTKERLIFQKVSWSLSRKKICLKPDCKKSAKWKVSLNNNSVYCCGNKHCRKYAEKFV